MNRRAPLIVGLKAEGMAGIILFVMLEGVYMRTLGVEAWARFGFAALLTREPLPLTLTLFP